MSEVTTVTLEDVEPIALPGGSWSRMVLTDRTLDGNAASLGYSVFTPGTVTTMVCHETEEIAYVLSGSGEMRLDDGVVPFAGGQGLFVPAGVWHAVANTGTEDVAMVFGFPHPDYPPTERRGAVTEARTAAGGPAAVDRAQQAETVAWASRILALAGYEDLTLGHVSARGADDRTIHIKRKGVALGEVTPADVISVDLDADYDRVPEGMHLETVLHTEVYKRRPDVRSVVHGHPPHATAFGATDAEFQYLTHDSVLFVGGITTYDGVPDLIMNARQGAEVAQALGAGTALLLRNHGVLVAERDVQWAVLASVLLERAVRLQMIAAALGPLHPIPQEILPQIHAVKYQADFPGEYWDAWVRELRRSGRAFGMPGEQ